MADVLLFHHVQGLTPGVVAFADSLREAGHTVHTPDLFDGRTFDSIEAGLAFAQGDGAPDFDQLADETAAALPESLVYGGFSMGEAQAQRLAQTRPGAAGALLFESCIPMTGDWAFGPWPDGVPVQIHGMDADAFFAGEGDIDAARADRRDRAGRRAVHLSRRQAPVRGQLPARPTTRRRRPSCKSGCWSSSVVSRLRPVAARLLALCRRRARPGRAGGVLGRPAGPAGRTARSSARVTDPEFELRFVPGATEKTRPNWIHLHLTSARLGDQERTVDRALELGATHLDVGQLPEEGHVVLADPEGNELCVIEPGNRFLAGTGFLGELACDGTRDVGLFWSDALDWPLNWDQDEETSVQSPLGGTKVSWGGPPVAAEGRADGAVRRRRGRRSRGRAAGRAGRHRLAEVPARAGRPGRQRVRVPVKGLGLGAPQQLVERASQQR